MPWKHHSVQSLWQHLMNFLLARAAPQASHPVLETSLQHCCYSSELSSAPSSAGYRPSSSTQRQCRSEANPDRKATQLHDSKANPSSTGCRTGCTDLHCSATGRASPLGEPQATKLSVYHRHDGRHNLDHGLKRALRV